MKFPVNAFANPIHKQLPINSVASHYWYLRTFTFIWQVSALILLLPRMMVICAIELLFLMSRVCDASKTHIDPIIQWLLSVSNITESQNIPYNQSVEHQSHFLITFDYYGVNVVINIALIVSLTPKMTRTPCPSAYLSLYKCKRHIGNFYSWRMSSGEKIKLYFSDACAHFTSNYCVDLYHNNEYS